MGQEKRGEPARGGIASQPVQYGIENRVEKKGKRANHDHDFKGHDEKNNDAAAGCNLTEKLQPIMIFHKSSF
jgi:hypothetical protein